MLRDTAECCGVRFILLDRLKTLTLPENTENIGKDAFRGCGAEAVVLPRSVAHIADGAFADCERLVLVTRDGCDPEIGQTAFGGSPLVELR